MIAFTTTTITTTTAAPLATAFPAGEGKMGRSAITFLHEAIAEGAPKLLLSLVTAAQETQDLNVRSPDVVLNLISEITRANARLLEALPHYHEVLPRKVTKCRSFSHKPDHD